MRKNDIRICNCAGCKRALVAVGDLLTAQKLSDKDRLSLGIPEIVAVAGRIKDRPYCDSCLNRSQFTSDRL